MGNNRVSAYPVNTVIHSTISITVAVGDFTIWISLSLSLNTV